MQRLAMTMVVMAALAAAGCKKPRTEMLITVQTDGVRVPEDVAQVRLLVTDRQSGGDGVMYDSTVPLCTPTSTTICYTLPLTAVLHPGPKQPSDTVRVQIDALARGGGLVTSSAATFAFSAKQSLRLDFILYAACIGVTDCAKRDQACGPDAMCTTLTPVQFEGEPDLGPGGGGGGADMASSDMAAPPGSDLAIPAGSDMSSYDMAHPPGSDMATNDMSIVTISKDMAIGPVCVPPLCDMGPVMTSDDGFIMMSQEKR
jgi:hypothetical protein